MADWLGRLVAGAEDLRSGTRILTRSPGLAASAVLVIALVIGGNTTVYTIVRGLTTNPAPGVAAPRLLSIGHVVGDRSDIEPFVSYPVYSGYAAQTTTMDAIVGFSSERFALGLDTGTFASFGALVTPGYFDTLGVPIVRGRALTVRDARADAMGLAAVISYRLWQEQFSGADSIEGASILINGQLATIVGVAGEGFSGPYITPREDVWVPLETYSRLAGRSGELVDRSRPTVSMIGRLAPAVSLDQAQAELDTMAARVETGASESRNKPVALPYSGTVLLPFSRMAPVFIAVFSVITALTILVVCANVANLLLGRAVARRRETAVRQSLGASNGDLFRMLLGEGLVLSLAAVAASCVCAWWMSRSLVTILIPASEAGLALNANLSPDWGVVVYALLLGGVATVAITVAPALSGRRQAVLPWLRAGEPTIAEGRSRVAQFLIVTQLALAIVLMTVAGLAYRSQRLLDAADLGFSPQNIILMTVVTDGSGVGDRDRQLASLERVRQRLRTVPGVTGATHVRHMPGVGTEAAMIRREDRDDPLRVVIQHVAPDYLATLGLMPLEGRDLLGRDDDRSVVVTRSLALALWPGQPALGRTLLAEVAPDAARGQRPPRPATVVGVAPDALFGGATRNQRPLFALFTERHDHAAIDSRTFYVRFREGVGANAPALTAALREVEPTMAVSAVARMETQLGRVTQNSRLVAVLLATFSGVSLVIATLGQYAVAAFNVRRRVREYGVRMALGASACGILAQVFREWAIVTLVGLGTGLALSVAIATVMSGLLFGVTPLDPSTYATVLAIVGATTLAAYAVPAGRAARIQPSIALRQD
jgi:predicted permease